MPYVYGTPPPVEKTEDQLEMMTRAPKREGNSNEVIHIRFPVLYQKDELSTPLKRRRDNLDATKAPMKERRKRKSNERDLKSAKKSLFTNKEFIHE